MFLFPKKKNKSSVLQCDKTHCSPVLMGNNRLKKKGEKDTDTLQRGGGYLCDTYCCYYF